MERYAKHSPTQFDHNIDIDRSEWLLVPVSQTRDSGPLERSNFACALEQLGGESENVEVHRFGHWGPGWYEIIIINPMATDLVSIGEDIERGLLDYPFLNNEHFSQLESEDANEKWKNCFSPLERIEYIRKHRNQFEFSNWADLMGCIRGEYFSGYASELLH